MSECVIARESEKLYSLFKTYVSKKREEEEVKVSGRILQKNIFSNKKIHQIKTFVRKQIFA